MTKEEVFKIIDNYVERYINRGLDEEDECELLLDGFEGISNPKEHLWTSGAEIHFIDDCGIYERETNSYYGESLQVYVYGDLKAEVYDEDNEVLLDTITIEKKELEAHLQKEFNYVD